jgi:tetratricopeptide (TPR) repeat protein
LDDAVPCFRHALELKPDYTEVHNNLGNALKDQGKLDEAVACFRRALELKPDFAGVHDNLGIALKDEGKLDEAVACFRRALELKPDFAEAHNNLGIALRELGMLDEGIACWRRALELKPDFAQARLNQSLISLLTGDFQRGWPEFEWRWKTKQCPRRDFSQAPWDGQPLEGSTILLHAEQGLGDTIQFIRYVPLVKQRGGAVIVECQRPLLSLLTSCVGIDRLVGRGEPLPAFDVQAPLLSLPGVFHTALGDVPAAVPYLFADPNLVQRWRQELGRLAGFKIGIAWQGNPLHQSDRSRSIPLGSFEPLARCSGVRLLSLQKEAGVEQLREIAGRFSVIDLGSRMDEASGAFMDTSAVMMSLDLVVTSDTAIAHLAGALGVPVWVALSFVPDWRWLLGRSDSPWYPTMRLFRQDSRGDWQGVFEKIKAELCAQLQSGTTAVGIRAQEVDGSQAL